MHHPRWLVSCPCLREMVTASWALVNGFLCTPGRLIAASSKYRVIALRSSPGTPDACNGPISKSGSDMWRDKYDDTN
jgi:hypothetical protein